MQKAAEIKDTRVLQNYTCSAESRLTATVAPYEIHIHIETLYNAQHISTGTSNLEYLYPLLEPELLSLHTGDVLTTRVLGSHVLYHKMY